MDRTSTSFSLRLFRLRISTRARVGGWLRCFNRYTWHRFDFRSAGNGRVIGKHWRRKSDRRHAVNYFRTHSFHGRQPFNRWRVRWFHGRLDCRRFDVVDRCYRWYIGSRYWRCHRPWKYGPWG